LLIYGLCLQVCFEFIGNKVSGNDDEDYDDSGGWQMLEIVENEVEYIFRKAIKLFSCSDFDNYAWIKTIRELI